MDTSKLLLTPQQEMQLGEIIRQQLESDFLVIDEDPMTGYLRRVGDRVARHLPETGLHYQFFLYDQPEIQAFGMPGGNIYVSRKMVAFLRSEDELAGLLGHELGHLAARQQALGLSRQFHDVLGIKSFSDNEDLFEKYNQLVESFRLKNTHGGSSGEEGKAQMIADQIGIEAVTRAGYAPESFPDFLDRLMQTKGKTGSWLSDLFGATRPDSKRLREALKAVGSLPAACVETHAAPRSEDFQKWQSGVLRYNGIGHEERLTGVLRREKLKNPLRGDIENFRFSPDGKYLLAQDDSGIYVLTRDPFSFIFRIEAPDAAYAQFTPDSRQIVFYSPALRVETWDIPTQQQVTVSDVAALRGCRQTALSPDARFLACFGNTFDLSLYNVATGETVFHKDTFFDLNSGFSYSYVLWKYRMALTRSALVVLRFSPDGRYFAASSPSGADVVFDLLDQKKINVSGTVHALMARQFTFAGPGRIVGLDADHPDKSPLVEFPGGKLIDRVPLGGGSLLAATNPRYLLVRPLQKKPVGAYDLQEKKIVFSNRTAATDVWGDTIASERLTGEVGLYKLAGAVLQSKLQLPLGKLGWVQAVAASPDLKWLAISNHTRGGVWSLDSYDRALYVRGFENVSGEPGQLFYFDFPKFEEAERTFVVMNPATKQSASRDISKDDDVRLFGSVILRTRHNGKDHQSNKNIELDVVDTAREKPLWSRNFPKQGPFISGSPASGRLVFLWTGNADGLKDEIARDPKLQSRWSKEGLNDTDYFAEIVDAQTGQVVGATAIHTGKRSFSIGRMEAAGDWLVGTDNRNRVLVFSTLTGEEKARWFGYRPRISPNGQRLCVSNGRGHLVLYDLSTLKQTGDLSFANRVSAALFSSDGNRLAVLTDDQTAFLMDASAVSASPPSGQAKNN